jgi:hypothetical protein
MTLTKYDGKPFEDEWVETLSEKDLIDRYMVCSLAPGQQERIVAKLKAMREQRVHK